MPRTTRISVFASAAFAALALTACGASDRQAPTLELPFTAPNGATGIVTDFTEVCSIALTDETAAITALSARGWTAPSGSDLEQIAAFGGYMSENENGETLQIYPLTFPHVDGTTCQVTSTYIDTMPNFSVLGDIPGLLGDIKTFGDRDEPSQIGRFSGIGPDGYPLTIQLISTADLYFNLSMTTTRPVKPSGPNQE